MEVPNREVWRGYMEQAPNPERRAAMQLAMRRIMDEHLKAHPIIRVSGGQKARARRRFERHLQAGNFSAAAWAAVQLKVSAAQLDAIAALLSE